MRFPLVLLTVALVACTVMPATALGRLALSDSARSAEVFPRIAEAHVRMRGYGPAGPDYFVLVTAKLRVCAATGTITVSVRERKYLGQEADPFAENFRSVRHRHPRRCGWHLVDWTLGDSFFGIGTYQVRLRVSDRFDRESRSVFRTFETLD